MNTPGKDSSAELCVADDPDVPRANGEGLASSSPSSQILSKGQILWVTENDKFQILLFKSFPQIKSHLLLHFHLTEVQLLSSNVTKRPHVGQTPEDRHHRATQAGSAQRHRDGHWTAHWTSGTGASPRPPQAVPHTPAEPQRLTSRPTWREDRGVSRLPSPCAVLFPPGVYGSASLNFTDSDSNVTQPYSSHDRLPLHIRPSMDLSRRGSHELKIGHVPTIKSAHLPKQ